MSAPTTTITSATPKPSSGLNGTIRLCISILIALMLGVFIMLWDGGFIPLYNIPPWMGPYIILPLLATILSYIANCMIQLLSCSQVQWLTQLQRVAFTPLPYFLTLWLLYMFPSMRWPIEGLAQQTSVNVRKGLSSGFYIFWTALYTQSMMNGMAQICPK